MKANNCAATSAVVELNTAFMTLEAVDNLPSFQATMKASKIFGQETFMQLMQI
jgi:hypothetical protein